MNEAMDKIVIDIESNSADAVNGLENLKNSLSKLQDIAKKASGLDENGTSKVNNLASALERLAEVGSGDKLKAALRFLRKLGKLDFNNLSSATKSISKLADMVGASKTKETAASGSSKDGTVPMDGEEVEGANEELKDTESLLQRIQNTISSGKFQKSIKTIGNGVSKLTEKIRTFFNSLVRIAFYRFIRFIISSITNAFKEGTNAVYQYSKAFNGTFAQSMDKLATSMNYLKGSLGAMLAPLITLITPAIETLVDKFVELVNVLNQVFARLSGAETWTKAIKVETEYAEATEAATEANEKLKQSFLGIDEINTLKDTTDSTSALSSYKFEEVAVDTEETDKIIEKFKNILEVAKQIGIVILGWKLASAFSSDLLSLSTLEKAVTLTLLIQGADLVFEGIKAMNNDDPDDDLKGAIKTLLGSTAFALGISKMTGIAWDLTVPIALVLSVVAILASVGDEVSKGLGEIQHIYDEWANEVREDIQDIFDVSTDNPFLQSLNEFFKSLCLTVYDAIIPLGDDVILPFCRLLADGIYDIFHGNWDDLLTDFLKFCESIYNYCVGIINDIGDLGDAIANMFIAGINKIIEGLNSLPFNFNIDYISEIHSKDIPTVHFNLDGSSSSNDWTDSAVSGLTGSLSKYANSSILDIQNKTSSSSMNSATDDVSTVLKESNTEVVTAIQSMSEQVTSAVKEKDTTITLDGQKVSKSVTKAQNSAARMYGATTLQYAQ